MAETGDPPDLQNPGDEVAKPRVFEGREVPREASGRVSRRGIPDIGDTLGTAEKITELTIRLAEMKAAGLNHRKTSTPAQFDLYRDLNVERARLMRRRTRSVVDRTRLRLIRARTAEKVARTAVDEAAMAVAGAASVLRGLVDRWTKISSGPLAESLITDLADDDPEVRQHAQDSIKDITVAVFDLHKSAQRLGKRDEQSTEKIVATWPSEGAKS